MVRPLAGDLPAGRSRRVALWNEQGQFDDGLAVLSRGPNSYTGEDTLEVTCHGNPILVDLLLGALLARGARMAEPGEFTRRALVNGKLDLIAAEAVDQVCRATTLKGVAIARGGLDGEISAFLDTHRSALIGVAADLEARLDYPADELAYLAEDQLVRTLHDAAATCRQIAGTFDAGRILVEGARVALVGAVNAGKSSLFNSILGRRRALVHALPGTTRDVLEVRHALQGCEITLLDTAGERQTDDPIEAAGLALARELVGEADLLVIVLRAGPDGPTVAEEAILSRTADRRRIVVYNGVDVPGCAPAPAGAISTSAAEDTGIEALCSALVDALVGQSPRSAEVMIASARQRDRLVALAACLDEAVVALPIAGVAVAADAVTRGIDEIDALTGADTREDVLDALFARFCIGK